MKSEAQAANPQPKTSSRSSLQQPESSQVFAPVNTNVVTRESILQLQRVIGNQAVQRLMGIKGAPQIQKADAPVAEKTSQGLMEEEASSRFAQTIFDWTKDPTNAEKRMADFTTTLEQALNVELDTAGVPRIFIDFETIDNGQARFVSSKWKVDVDCDQVFGGILQTVGDLEDEKLKEVVGTLYHEGRHAEQYYLIARVRAAEMLDQGQSPEQIAQALATGLNIKDTVATLAAVQPLRDADAATLSLIESLEQSMFGEDSAYQNLVYTMYDDAVKPVFNVAVAVQSAVPGDYDGKTPEEQDTVKSQVGFLVPLMETSCMALRSYLNTKLQPELDRVLAKPISIPPGNNGVMLNHLDNLIEQVKRILQHQPFPHEPMQALESALTIQTAAKEIKHELLMANWDLPEQVDAENAGQQAGKAFAELGQQEK